MKDSYLVQDYMRDDVKTIAKTASLKEAIALMAEHKTNALVIVTTDNEVEGIVTSWGVIESTVPDYLEDDKHLASFESSDVFAERVKIVADTLVEEVMSTDVHTISPHDSLMEAATRISQFHIRQLPVVTEENKLVGYINHTDIKWAIANILGIGTPSNR